MVGEDTILETSSLPPPLAKPKARPLLLCAALVAGCGTAAYFLAPALTPQRTAPEPAQSQLAPLIAEYAAQLDSTAPAAAGQGSRMIDASASGERLVLRMRLDEDVPADELGSVQARLSASDTAELCGSPEMRLLIDEGATIERSYTDRSGDAMRTRTRSCAGQAAPPEDASVPMAM